MSRRDNAVILSIRKNHHRRFAPDQTLFKHNSRARLAEYSLDHQIIYSPIKLFLIVSYANAFTSGQAVGFDDDRKLILKLHRGAGGFD